MIAKKYCGCTIKTCIESHGEVYDSWWKMMLSALQAIAERKISEWMKDEHLSPSSWRGKALPRDCGDPWMPQELKMAYKILKNAGYLPAEIQQRQEIHSIEQMLENGCDEETRLKQLKKLNLLAMKISMNRGRAVNLDEYDEYRRKIVERISIKKKIHDI